MHVHDEPGHALYCAGDGAVRAAPPHGCGAVSSHRQRLVNEIVEQIETGGHLNIISVVRKLPKPKLRVVSSLSGKN
eukprot:3599719-Pleurochrysis_carterae.AAC.1